jgi:HEAT repeat protein
MAARNLGTKPDPRVAPALVQALADPDHDVRCAAADVLGGHDPAVAVEPLLALLASRGLGHECAYAPLGRLRDPRAVAPLLAVTMTPEGYNGRAFAALAAIGPAAVAPLAEALGKETKPPVAEGLARALVTAGGKEALPPLLALLAADDENARSNAATALGMLGDSSAQPALSKAADAGNYGAVSALVHVGEAGRDDVLARLDHADPKQRAMAAGALGKGTDPALVPRLEQGLQSPKPNVVSGSAGALAQLAGGRLDIPGPNPDFPLHDAAAAALDRAWERGDARIVAAAAEYYVRRHPDGEDRLLEALARHGDERLAVLYLNSGSDRLYSAAVAWAQARGLRPCSLAPGNFTC